MKIARIFLVCSIVVSLCSGSSGALWAEPPSSAVAPARSDAPSAPVVSGEQAKISLDLKGMDVVEVIKMLSTKGGFNVVIGNDVKGRVTIFLKNVNVMDALEIILVANSLAYDKRGDIFYIMTQKEYESIYGDRYSSKKEVKIFPLKYAKAVDVSKTINQMKSTSGKVIVDEGSNTLIVFDGPEPLLRINTTIAKIDMPTVTRVFGLKYAKAADIKTKVSESLTKGVGTMQIDERTNKIMVIDLENKMDDIAQMVSAFDSKPPQVLIEAKIIEITLDDTYKLGVDWDSLLKKLNKEISLTSTFQLAAQNALIPGGQIVLGTLGSNSVNSYAVMIQALKTIGDTNILSSPRILAINNQEAKILIGTSQPYATNTVTQGTSTTTTGTNLTFLDVGVKLYVTPSINTDGFVTMKIKPEVSSVSDQYTYGSPSTTVPVVSTTQAETSVTVKDGTTIIIAGLMKDQRTSTVSKIPLIGDIPIVGKAFQKDVKETKKNELVVFLTPRIIEGDTDLTEIPSSPPYGEKRFTLNEKPAFETRRPATLDPRYFGQGRQEAREASSQDQKAEEDFSAQTMVAPVSINTPDDYYSIVKSRIIENIKFPKDKRYLKLKGSVDIEFYLAPDGSIATEPRVIRSTNHILDEHSLKAVRTAAPFPAFISVMGAAAKKFVIGLSFE